MSSSYFVRITPRHEGSLQQLETIVSPLASKYVISQETTPRLHFHLCLWANKSIENLRYHLKSHIDGQIYISGKDIDNKIQAIAYTIKDGNYVHRGLDVAEFLLANQVAKPKANFEQLIKDLTNKYEPRTMSDQSLIKSIIQIYIDCHRKPYKQHIRALFDTIKLSKDSAYIDRITEQILLNI